MRIGIDARFYKRATGGIGRYTRGLLRELANLDTGNQYFVFLTPEDMKEWEAPGENFSPVEVDIPYYSLTEQTKLSRIFKQYKLDLIHYTNFNHPLLCPIPFVATIHDLTMTLYPVGRKQKNPIRKLAYDMIMKHAARAAKRVIVPSEVSKKDVVEMLGAKPEKVIVTYEAIDDQYGWEVNSKIKEEIRRQYGIRKPFILFISQWRPHKGIKPLIEAYKLLRRQYEDDVELVLGGKPNNSFPELIKTVEETQAESGGVITPGFVPEEDLPALYAACELYVLPSLYEGFCLTHLEAMAAGAPVATSNVSCMPEVLGEAAAYFDPKDPHDIARVLDRLLNDESERKQLAEKGKKQVQKYSWAKMARETLEIYEGVISK